MALKLLPHTALTATPSLQDAILHACMQFVIAAKHIFFAERYLSAHVLVTNTCPAQAMDEDMTSLFIGGKLRTGVAITHSSL